MKAEDKEFYITIGALAFTAAVVVVDLFVFLDFYCSWGIFHD